MPRTGPKPRNQACPIIEEDVVSIESFFTIPDEDIEFKLHLQVAVAPSSRA
ncbi:hypothetical protein AZE42_11811 [Rhizopogon vesiculosus]|uniref:Uncharacterized protein n=1 Tax=Rhizopogon vesiculosus TaxID=180088 RepID=A0A1J8QQC7_9AGAM|nr:hypothetical protein AZE42_11811 [Rhizopogon vesiculosus]